MSNPTERAKDEEFMDLSGLMRWEKRRREYRNLVESGTDPCEARWKIYCPKISFEDYKAIETDFDQRIGDLSNV